jgi:Fur family ferric uptake transcriptional regulator
LYKKIIVVKQAIEEILRHFNLSVTDGRKKILRLFINTTGALSHGDIEKGMKDFDRVTIYRTLQIFTEKGIIHTIPTADNSVLYALCKSNCSEGHHHDNHVHFLCDICGKTFCLENTSIPEIRLPKGFMHQQTDVVVSGKCAICAGGK